MSRIGKLPVHISSGVTATVKDNMVTVKGPKGELTQKIKRAGIHHDEFCRQALHAVQPLWQMFFLIFDDHAG